MTAKTSLPVLGPARRLRSLVTVTLPPPLASPAPPPDSSTSWLPPGPSAWPCQSPCRVSAATPGGATVATVVSASATRTTNPRRAPTRVRRSRVGENFTKCSFSVRHGPAGHSPAPVAGRSEEHTSELQSLRHLVCRLLLEK